MTELVSLWILTILIAFPLVVAGLLFVLPREQIRLVRHVALWGSVLELLLSLHLIAYFKPDSDAIQFAQQGQWLPELGVSYLVGVDGLSLILVLLTTVLSPLVLLSTFESVTEKVREFNALFLVLMSAMVGALVSLDLVLFYVFWEAMLIPMYFMIGIWGGKDRIYAATKLFIYTVFGSLLMLAAFVYLYFEFARTSGGSYSTSLLDIYGVAATLPFETQLWLFVCVTLAFAIKVPLFPFHTWLPDAHVQAPTAGSVILAGVLLKMGTYGLLRFSLPLFPDAARAAGPTMVFLGVIGVIWGALIAWRQTDIKKLVAYSSVSHLGIVVAAIFSFNIQGASGALLQMVNHGVSTGALFLLIGSIYERRHTREMSDFGGLAKQMPVFALFLLIATLGSVALPGTGGFIGEWLMLFGIFKQNPLMGVLAGTGVIWGALYMLWCVRKVIWGPLDNPENKALEDLNPREIFIMVVLAVFVFVPGFFSAGMLAHTQATLNKINQSVLDSTPYNTRLDGGGR